MTRILIAEDDRDIREMIDAKLTDVGYETVAVADGEAALRECTEHRFDLAVLDIMMPGMSGLETLEILRRNPWFVDMPVVFVTALKSEYDVKRGYERGASAYLTKPFSLADLAERVESLLVAGATT